jgi:CrcB protein
MTPCLILAVVVGGALGALLRYGAQLLWPARSGRVPRAVLLVNVVGSALAGVFLALSTSSLVIDMTASGAGVVQSGVLLQVTSPAIDPGFALIVMTGFCGGLTTFSTFSVETVELATSGAWRAAATNVVLTVVLGLAAAGIAFAATHGVLVATSGAVMWS